MLSRYYITGNMIDGNSKNWDAVTYDKNATYVINGKHHTPDPNHFYGDVTYSKNTAGTDCVQMELTNPTDYGTVTTHNAQTAFNKVLDYAGASLHRDNVDARYMKEAKNGTATYSGSVTGKPGRIDLVSDVNGYTEENFGTGNRPNGFDTDKDGMPDEWEQLNGGDLNPNEYTLDSQNRWYTNLEVYLSSIVEDIMQGGNSDAQSGVDEYYPACVKMPDDDPTPTPTTNCSILWKFDTGADGQQPTLSGLAQNGIKSATVTLGSELAYNGKLNVKAAGLTETKIQQTKVNDNPTDANTIIFSITPADGYTLKPTSVMFTATRTGTDRGKIDAKWVDDNGVTVICTAETPKRDKDTKEDQSPYYSTYSTDLDGDATTGECKLIINLYALSLTDTNTGAENLKDVGFCNISIEGIMTAPEVIKGDVNGDGKVDMSDVTDLVQYILGNPAEDFNADAADVNGDDAIGMPDVMFLVQYILNGKFPTE